MKRLINALSELLEAKAELSKEEAAMLHLGTYSRGYKDGQEDTMRTYGLEVVYVTGDDDDEDENG